MMHAGNGTNRHLALPAGRSLEVHRPKACAVFAREAASGKSRVVLCDCFSDLESRIHAGASWSSAVDTESPSLANVAKAYGWDFAAAELALMPTRRRDCRLGIH